MKTGIAAVVLIVVVVFGSTVGYLVGMSAQRVATSTATSTSTISAPTTVIETNTLTLTSTYRVNVAAEGEALDSQGIELLLSINSTTIRPNGTISIDVDNFNTLPTSNNVTGTSHWRVQGLTWPCGYQSWSTNDIGVMRGYYTLSNITTGTFLSIWAALMCPADFVFNSTGGIDGLFLNATSYSFLPGSDRANISVYYTPTNASGLQTGLIAKETIGPYYMGGPGETIHATNASYLGLEDSLGSSAPGVYTIVAADEWGNLVLLHFRVE